MKYVEKYGRAKPATDDNIIWRIRFTCLIAKATHTRARTHTHTHTHALTIRNTYCFPTAAMVTRTRLNVSLFVNCLYC